MSGNLNHSVAQIIQQLLVDNALGTLPTSSGDWPVSNGYERDNPDNFITVYNTAPQKDGRHHTNGETQQHYGIQVRVRGQDEDTAFLKAQAIATDFDGVTRQSVSITSGTSSTYLVQAIHHTGGPLPLGRESDVSDRRLFTLNALINLRMTSP